MSSMGSYLRGPVAITSAGGHVGGSLVRRLGELPNHVFALGRHENLFDASRNHAEPWFGSRSTVPPWQELRLPQSHRCRERQGAFSITGARRNAVAARMAETHRASAAPVVGGGYATELHDGRRWSRDCDGRLWVGVPEEGAEAPPLRAVQPRLEPPRQSPTDALCEGTVQHNTAADEETPD